MKLPIPEWYRLKKNERSKQMRNKSGRKKNSYKYIVFMFVLLLPVVVLLIQHSMMILSPKVKSRSGELAVPATILTTTQNDKRRQTNRDHASLIVPLAPAQCSHTVTYCHYCIAATHTNTQMAPHFCHFFLIWWRHKNENFDQWQQLTEDKNKIQNSLPSVATTDWRLPKTSIR